MTITYIHHSGFLVETADQYYLFDYYKGDLPPLKTDKPILVFASHNHQDHYNPEIFGILQELGMQHITAVLGKDIPPKKYPQNANTYNTNPLNANALNVNTLNTNSRIEVIKAYAHRTYELPCNTRVQTLLSTDAGVAFLVMCPEGTIYHAGDLNDWVWEEETEQYNKQITGSYRHEIDLLKDISVDVAFIPLDPRQEKAYAKGMLYFLRKVKVTRIYPMHYWEQPDIIQRFLEEYPEYTNIIINPNVP